MLPSGIVTSYSYDSVSRLVGLTCHSGSTTLGNLAYRYDFAGCRTSAGGSLARTGLPLAVTLRFCVPTTSTWCASSGHSPFSTVEDQARLGTVPTDEFIDGISIRLLGTRRCERVQNRVFDCSKSGNRSILLACERLLVFFRCPILAASCAAFSMVIHEEG